ncbi:MAG: sialate O-acetylesterase [Cyclobacteriaceae bacterium]
MIKNFALKKSSTFLIFCFLFTSLSAQQNLDLYLLIGQSNMAGRGTLEAQDTIPLQDVYMLTKELNWVPAKDPIHFDKDIAGVGLGKSFAEDISKMSKNQIGLIPCAVGGSGIDTWKPGGYHESTNTHPWDDMVPRLKHALQYGQIKGVLWHQGESDSKVGLADQYKAKLLDLIQRVRALIDKPELPFVLGQMLPEYLDLHGQERKDNPIYPETVWEATQEVAKADPKVTIAKSEGLKGKDGVHFNSAGYRKLGKRYAKAMKKLL